MFPHEEGRFWLGRAPGSEAAEPLGFGDDRHVLLVSGSRSGKGTTTIIPNLLLWPGSVVVVDPKGENASVAASRRGQGSEYAAGMGQKVYVLDPFRVARIDEGYRACFNPLDALDPDDPGTVDEAGRLADALVVINPNSNDPFWDQSARTLVKGLVLHVLTAPEYEGRRNLVTVRSLLTRGDQEGVTALRDELGEEDVPTPHALLWESIAGNDAFDGVVAGIGEGMASVAASSPKTFESVLQVASRNTEFLDSPGMRACLASSDFSLADLKADPDGVSLFLSLPQRYMGEHFRWLRMMISLITAEVEARPGQPVTGHRILMVLDEFAGLKKLEAIQNAVAQVAGYGLKLFFVLQSLEQLKETYKDGWETFLSNASLKLFFGLDDQFSRKYVSEFIGETEIIRTTRTESEAEGENRSRTRGRSTTKGTSESTNTGESYGESSSFNTSRNRGKSRSAKSLPLYLHNTAHVLKGLVGQVEAGSNFGTSEGESKGTNLNRSWGKTTGISESVTLSESETYGQSKTTTEGTNEGIHKRPLITPDEIGRYFSRLDDADHPLHPGLALMVLPGTGPVAVRRTNYFADERFRGLFDPHPDHPFKALPEPEAPPEMIRYRVGLEGLDRVRLLSGVIDVGGFALPKAEWLVEKGEPVRQNQPILRIGPLIKNTMPGNTEWTADMPGVIELQSPFDGVVVDAPDFADGILTEDWVLTLEGEDQPVALVHPRDATRALDRYVRAAHAMCKNHVGAAVVWSGILLGLGVTCLVWLLIGWPSRIVMGLGLLACFGIWLAAVAARRRRLSVYHLVASLDVETMSGSFTARKLEASSEEAGD
ncbi:MAG: type IV secretory system conjugative DNA transfer family protein [Planctomycetota bacterium]